MFLCKSLNKLSLAPESTAPLCRNKQENCDELCIVPALRSVSTLHTLGILLAYCVHTAPHSALSRTLPVQKSRSLGCWDRRSHAVAYARVNTYPSLSGQKVHFWGTSCSDLLVLEWPCVTARTLESSYKLTNFSDLLVPRWPCVTARTLESSYKLTNLSNHLWISSLIFSEY